MSSQSIRDYLGQSFPGRFFFKAPLTAFRQSPSILRVSGFGPRFESCFFFLGILWKFLGYFRQRTVFIFVLFNHLLNKF